LRRAAASGFLVGAAALSGATPIGDCRAPVLRIEASSASPRQGGVVALTVLSSVPLSRATLSDGKHEAAMEADEAATTLRALWGIDFESAVGARRVHVEAVGRCGDAHSSSWDLKVVAGKFPSQQLKVDPAYVEVPPAELERIAADKEKVARVWATGGAVRRWDGPFRLPVEAPVRENFGARRLFNGKPRSRHEGVDLAAPAGAPVTAPAPGVVALAEELYFSGGTVILDHGASLFTSYFHLSRIDVKVGDLLEPGTSLGAVGATGRATGPHLHWGARVNRSRVNALDLLHLPHWPTEH
jgi:murein DD-endopeptidase MepM/ murein hydrolase activator NlpD